MDQVPASEIRSPRESRSEQPTDPPSDRVWIVSITERYGELETVTRHAVYARDWSDAMDAGRDICAYGMRGDWVQREDTNTWSYLGFEQTATVYDAVEVATFEDVLRAIGGRSQRPVGRELPPIGLPYDVTDEPDWLEVRPTFRL